MSGTSHAGYRQITWNEELVAHVRDVVRLAVREDLGRWHDWTTLALVPADQVATADVVTRQAGVVAGISIGQIVLEEMQTDARWLPHVQDGQHVTRGIRLATLAGKAQDILVAERLLLNLLGRLCGIATETARYVSAVTGTAATIYDTRKTTPGMRRLEKYAVRCGGGTNHRAGLYDGILIKDNHLAFFTSHTGPTSTPVADAVRQARQFLRGQQLDPELQPMVLEVEVDTLEQLREVLPAGPDVVLLDNMSPQQLQTAVELRNREAPAVQLEASGGVQLETVAAIAHTGVDRISVGALTHSVPAFDVGLDWQP